MAIRSPGHPCRGQSSARNFSAASWNAFARVPKIGMWSPPGMTQSCACGMDRCGLATRGDYLVCEAPASRTRGDSIGADSRALATVVLSGLSGPRPLSPSTSVSPCALITGRKISSARS